MATAFARGMRAGVSLRSSDEEHSGWLFNRHSKYDLEIWAPIPTDDETIFVICVAACVWQCLYLAADPGSVHF